MCLKSNEFRPNPKRRTSSGGASSFISTKRSKLQKSLTSSQFKFNSVTPNKQADASNYRYHDPNLQGFNYQIPVTSIPKVAQFFPNLSSQRPSRILGEIAESANDNEHVPAIRGRGRDRTNSDNWQQFLSNDI